MLKLDSNSVLSWMSFTVSPKNERHDTLLEVIVYSMYDKTYKVFNS